jgi:Glycosyl-hydrolase family 116, catalytic region
MLISDDAHYMVEKGTNLSSSSSAEQPWQDFITKAEMFARQTSEHVLQGVNPGGVYQAIWCRDASYILGDWFFSGNYQGALQQIYQIWSHQISPNMERLVYGRGSPELKFSAKAGGLDIQKKFEGALPTTIYQIGFSEVYGKNPDIDSTSLMMGTSSYILARVHAKKEEEEGGDSVSTMASEHSSDYITSLLSKVGITDPSHVTEFVVPRMLKAVEYLQSRDIDNDGLLEQSHNEDWMDTALRAGKIVYSQGCWIFGLIHLSVLLSKLGRGTEATRITRLADKAIDAVNQKLWSEEDGTYLDIQTIGSDNSDESGDKTYRLLTQDVTYYLTAATANTVNDSFEEITLFPLYLHRVKQMLHKEPQEKNTTSRKFSELHHRRAISTLDAIKKRVWKDKWPLVTEGELKKTGPWPLKPYQYHNHTFWPWTTGVEMLARSRFNQVEECNILLSKLTSKDKKSVGTHTFYEWINPITDVGGGAYPFRTGISTVRLAISDLVQKIRTKHFVEP